MFWTSLLERVLLLQGSSWARNASKHPPRHCDTAVALSRLQRENCANLSRCGTQKLYLTAANASSPPFHLSLVCHLCRPFHLRLSRSSTCASAVDRCTHLHLRRRPVCRMWRCCRSWWAVVCHRRRCGGWNGLAPCAEVEVLHLHKERWGGGGIEVYVEANGPGTFCVTCTNRGER